MQKIVIALFLVMFAVVPGVRAAEDVKSLISEADALFNKAHADVTDPKMADLYMKSYQLCVKAAKLEPNSYEVNWKAARAARSYCWLLKNHLVKGYVAECTRVAKDGMRYGAKAIELEPNKKEGLFWYGGCIGSYADGVSILTALKEGLKGKTQSSFETAYRLDESYWDYCGNLALGEFWFMLPWPMNDKKKARTYLERYLKVAPAGSDNVEEGQTMLGRLLLESKDKADQEQGKALLEKAAKGRYPYYRKMAQDVLAGKKV